MAGSSSIGGLSDLTSDRPPLSPGTSKKNVRFSPKSPRKNDGPEDHFEKVMKRPLSTEAAQAAMDTMQDAFSDKNGATEEDRAKLYWKIQNYKRSFKDSVSFNNRVTRDSPMPVLQKEFESIQNQINSRNGFDSAKNLSKMLMTGIETGSRYYNPTQLNFKGLAAQWGAAVDSGHMHQELTELSIKYGDWLSSGPEIRMALGLFMFMKAVGENNTRRTSPDDPIDPKSVATQKFSDL